jgi:A/G-specific adenine glycosylase
MRGRSVKEFKRLIWGYYAKHGRSLPWRMTRDPYRILVSEIMLQQTQVSRVLAKYPLFIKRFPTMRSLAHGGLREIMLAWQGLGYNRRALLLKRLAETVVVEHRGRIPRERETLKGLPGVGNATSGALCAFAFNQPEAFIETNIRSVFIHYFFQGKRSVRDSELLPFVERSVEKTNPREWYYALMDYGVHLKDTIPDPGKKSAHYKKQAPFEGSNRQLRGMILKALVERKRLTVPVLNRLTGCGAKRLQAALRELRAEGLITKKGLSLQIC